MSSSLVQLTLLSILLVSLKVSQVNASNEQQLIHGLKNEFTEYVERTKLLEKVIEDFEPKLTVVEAHTKNLQADVSELTNVSVVYTEKLFSFMSYKEKTDKLEDNVVHFKETVKNYGQSVSTLEAYKNRTNILEDQLVDINTVVENNNRERNAISENIDTFKKAYEAEQKDIKSKVGKINNLVSQQVETVNKLDNLTTVFGTEKEIMSVSLNSVLENCTAGHQEISTKLQEMNTVATVQDEMKKKLNDLISELERQKNASSEKIESLRNNFTAEQSKIKSELERLGPLTNSQSETSKKLDSLAESLDKITKEQEKLKADLKQLSDQLQQFIMAHTTTPAPPTTTPSPGSQPIVIRKRIHASGNNIRVTI